MLAYRFAIHDNGSKSEDLGVMALADDAEAVAFGKHTIRDLMDGDAKQYIGWSMNITEGKRAVSSLPFEFYAHPSHPDHK
jgi:hypothetical protein